MIEKEKVLWIICHREDTAFRSQCYRACKLILVHETNFHASLNESSSSDTKENQCRNIALSTLIEEFNKKYEEKLNESTVKAMKLLIEVDELHCVIENINKKNFFFADF